MARLLQKVGWSVSQAGLMDYLKSDSFAWTLSSSAVAPNPLPCAHFGPLCPLQVPVGAKSTVAVTHTMALPQREKGEGGSRSGLSGSDNLWGWCKCIFSAQKAKDKSFLTDHPSLFLTRSASFGDELSVTGETLKTTTSLVWSYDPVSISIAYSEEKVKIYPHRTSA